MVWWAAGINGLHPDIQYKIKQVLSDDKVKLPKILHKAWQLIFVGSVDKTHELRKSRYLLEKDLKQFGWDNQIIRKYGEIKRPYISVCRNNYGGLLPPVWSDELRKRDILNLDVKYPTYHRDIKVPDEWLPDLIRELRLNLKLANQLESEIGGHGLTGLPPIQPDTDPNIEQSMRNRGLIGSVNAYASLFRRLAALDSEVAKSEFLKWPVLENAIFTRLKLWVCGLPNFIKGDECAEIIFGLSQESFWDDYSQRDLLLVLAVRWNHISGEKKMKLEKRLLAGPTRFQDESIEEYEKYRVGRVLERIHWLEQKGCEFTLELTEESEKLRKLIPEWNPTRADDAARSLEVRVGWVGHDKDFSALIGIPLDFVLQKAKEISKTHSFNQRKNPFAGLSEEYPLRALSALTLGARRGEYPEWAWRAFLNASARNEDKPKLMALIAERLYRYPEDQLAAIIRPVSDWLYKVVEKLSLEYPDSFRKIARKLIFILQKHPEKSDSALLRNREEVDWLEEAINSPTGIVSQVMLRDARLSGVQQDKKLPADWLIDIEGLLSLEGDPYRYVLVIFAYRLTWFFWFDQEWSEKNLLAALDGVPENQDALWQGFTRGPDEFHADLFIRIKQYIIDYVSRRGLVWPQYNDGLAAIILTGWLLKTKSTQCTFVSSTELRNSLIKSNESFRLSTLRVVRNSVANELKGKSGNMISKIGSFFQDVWPRQMKLKNPEVSKKILEIAFLNKNVFSDISNYIIPLLCPCDGIYLHLPKIKATEDNLVDLYPAQMLAILNKVLPGDLQYWPWDIDEYLDRIREADSSLKTDAKLLELRRKWNSR